METTQQSILDLARTRGLLRPLDLAGHGLPRVSLTRLVRQGRLARVGRGLHALPDRGFKYRNKIGLDVALEALNLFSSVDFARTAATSARARVYGTWGGSPNG